MLLSVSYVLSARSGKYKTAPRTPVGLVSVSLALLKVHCADVSIIFFQFLPALCSATLNRRDLVVRGVLNASACAASPIK